jgi:hypothetical protein
MVRLLLVCTMLFATLSGFAAERPKLVSGEFSRTALGAPPPAAAQAAPDAMTPVQRGRGYDVYQIAFVGGEPAIVGFASAVGKTLYLLVFDTTGKLICRSTSTGEEKTCEWTPEATADYGIVVRSSGEEDISYRIWTN